MADHLGDRTGHGDRPGLLVAAGDDARGADREYDVAHVVDRGVGDHPLEVGLGQGDQGAVQDGHDAHHDDDPRPVPPRVGQHRHPDAHEPVGAHLQQHPGQHRGADRRGVGVCGRQPGVERHRRGLHGEADQDRGQHEPPGEAVVAQRGSGRELDHVEGVRVGGDVQADEAQQQRERAEEGVEEELQRRPGGVAVAPAGDREVHPDDRQVEEDEEQDEVGGDEQPEAHRLQEQEQGRLQSWPVPLA